MPDIADEAENEHELMIECGLMAIRSQFSASSAVSCLDCCEPIPEQRRRLLPGVETCVPCQEIKEFLHRVGARPSSPRHDTYKEDD
jgi:phage/conjugal plasmid C-4 type zinc finger TraR family protein